MGRLIKLKVLCSCRGIVSSSFSGIVWSFLFVFLSLWPYGVLGATSSDLFSSVSFFAHFITVPVCDAATPSAIFCPR